MGKALKIVLMVCAIVLVLAVSGSMIYYFAFFIPGNEKAKWEAELEWEKEKQRQEDLKEKQRERALQNCLEDAHKIYIDAWDKQVERLDSKDGFLPSATADNLDERYEKDKDECFKLYGPD